MGKSTTAVQAKTSQRRALCEELLRLRRRYSTVFLQIDDLKSTLIKVATDAGEGSFREIFDLGQVTVAGAKPREFKGHKAEVDEKVLNNLSEVKRQKLIDAGIIKIVPQYSGEFYGRVNLKIF